jgi:hypothetical protein
MLFGPICGAIILSSVALHRHAHLWVYLVIFLFCGASYIWRKHFYRGWPSRWNIRGQIM